MRVIVEPSPPTQRPEDPFVREMGDAIWQIEGNYHREGSGPGSRFANQLLADIQAAYIVGKTRWHDAQAIYELRPTGWMHTATRADPLTRGTISQVLPEFEVHRVGSGPVAKFVATPEQAHALLALINRAKT